MRFRAGRRGALAVGLALAAAVVVGCGSGSASSSERFCSELVSTRAYAGAFFAGLGPAPSALSSSMLTSKLLIAFRRIDASWARLRTAAPSSIRSDMATLESLFVHIVQGLAHTATIAQFADYERRHAPSAASAHADTVAGHAVDHYVKSVCRIAHP